MNPFAWFDTTVPSVGMPKNPVSHLPFPFSSWKQATAYVPDGIGSKRHIDSEPSIEHQVFWMGVLESFGNPFSEPKSKHPERPRSFRKPTRRTERTPVWTASARVYVEHITAAPKMPAKTLAECRFT